jgi:hypothetical protein
MHTFLFCTGRGFQFRIVLCFANTLDVNLFGLSQFSTMIALRHRATFLFYFEERSVGMLARGGTMAFDTGFATTPM